MMLSMHSIKEERGELSQVTGNFTPPEKGRGGEYGESVALNTDGVSIIRIPTDQCPQHTTYFM